MEHVRVSSRRIRVVHDAHYEVVTTANVVGELAGTGGTGERAVIGGHYDSQLEGVGASDNASGIASLLEVANVLAERSLHRRLVFVAFADEEGGFRGSTHYCRLHRDSLERTIGMVNLDAPGWAPSQRSLHADASIRTLAVETARRVDWSPDEEMDASLFPGSDHNPFIDAGIPACFFWRHPPHPSLLPHRRGYARSAGLSRRCRHCRGLVRHDRTSWNGPGAEAWEIETGSAMAGLAAERSEVTATYAATRWCIGVRCSWNLTQNQRIGKWITQLESDAQP